ncbi:MAG: sterol desaturase family protein [Chitinophagales bacterium]
MIENDPVIYAIPIFNLLIIVEFLLHYKERTKTAELKDSLASIAMGLGSIVINFGAKAAALAVYYFLYQFRIFDLGWQWWVWLLLLFADDFTFYWHHRLSHQIRLLWAAHINHHSSERYNLTTALRQSWTEELYKYGFWCWLPLVGFSPIMIMMMISISLIYQFFLHTETVKKLGFLELFMNTPSHHRVHHATNIQYLDRNHAGIFIIWDKIFGTFQVEEAENKPVFGITNNIDTFNPLKIASHEFVNLRHDVSKAPTFIDKIKYVFMPPGWRHEGEISTSKYLQQKWKKEHQE